MLVKEKGTVSGSEHFHPQASKIAEKLIYYVTGCGVYFCDYGYRIEREDYGNYMMIYVTQGVLAVSTGEETYLVREGQAAFLNCHVYHSYYAKGFVSFAWIHFDGSNTADFHAEFMKMRQGIVFDNGFEKYIYKNMLSIISCYKNDMNINEVEHSKLLYDCLCTLIFSEEDRERGKVGEVASVTQAKEFIRNNINQQLTLDIVAKQVGLSSCHFSRLFKKATSYSPYEYIILVRLNKAKHLLYTTENTVKEIAYEVGYCSESNFCNAFTAKIGISPTHYRKYKL